MSSKQSIIKIYSSSKNNLVYSNRNYYHTINVLRNLADLLEGRYIKIKRGDNYQGDDKMNKYKTKKEGSMFRIIALKDFGGVDWNEK